jgi:hypothetical protein
MTCCVEMRCACQALIMNVIMPLFPLDGTRTLIRLLTPFPVLAFLGIILSLPPPPPPPPLAPSSVLPALLASISSSSYLHYVRPPKCWEKITIIFPAFLAQAFIVQARKAAPATGTPRSRLLAERSRSRWKHRCREASQHSALSRPLTVVAGGASFIRQEGERRRASAGGL